MKLVTTIALFFVLINQNSFGCTMFSFQEGNINYFGNNEDWSDDNPIIGFSKADANNFGFVWLGFSNGWAQGGMNEAGLCFDWYAGYSTNWTADPSKPNFNGDMCKEILRKCTTVEEVFEYYRKYNEPAFLHARPMYIDRDGNSIILKWLYGQVQVEYKSGNYQLQGAKATTIRPMLEGQVQITLPYMANVLDKAHQEGDYPTQYSNIFDTYNSKVYLFTSFNYSQCILIDLKTELGKGSAIYNIKELFISHALGQEMLVSDPANIIYYNENNTLESISPNPFSSSTTIKFSLRNSEFVSVKIYNVKGQLVESLIDQNLSEGVHQIRWKPKGLTGCIYYCQLILGDIVETQKLTLIVN
jgi:hypothetical protein